MTRITDMPTALLPLSGTEMIEVIQNGRNRKTLVSNLPGGGVGGGGLQGTAGSNGTQGTAGSNGTQGTAGSNGTQGTSGKSSPRGITIPSPLVNDTFTLFYTTYSITITKLTAVLQGGSSPSVTYTLRYASDSSAAGTEVVTGGSTTTNVTTGAEVTAFNSATIPAGSFVWIKLTAVSGAPASFHMTMEY